MPEIINSLFGRPRHDTPNPGHYVAPTAEADSTQPDAAGVAVTDETVDINAIPAETVAPTDDAAETEDAVESTEADPADSDAESADDVDELDDADESDDADDQADDDEAVADDDADEATAEESDEDATDEDLAEEAAAEDDESVEEAAAEDAEDAESVADEDTEPVEAEEAPVAAETDADTDADADDADETEPVAEPVTAEARPAADARGSVTVADGVVGKVVNIVVGKVDGVHSLDNDGLSIEVADDVATIKVSLVVEYGHAIKALAEQIRVDVIEAVEQFLGLDVSSVDVHVSDIHAAD